MTSPQQRWCFDYLLKKMAPGIATKIALLTWLLAVLTLLVFVVTTVPQQKKNYLTGLESKANSVAVSLRDVAAGAAVSDDLASVVSACQTLLQGDPEIDFLIVTKNNGFSLINQQSGWRVETELGEYWRPSERAAHGQIAQVPLIEGKHYHYAQPFDYSGVQWGWIHVGLSLERYQSDIQLFYRNTLILTLVCILLGLFCAVIFSRQIVRPVLHLRHIVKKVTDGDLSVRAQTNRWDELGSLSTSVNTMIENLIRRDQILGTVRFSAQHFMQISHWEDAMIDVLGKIGQATRTCHVSFFLNHKDADGNLSMSLKYEWVHSSQKSLTAIHNLQKVPYSEVGLSHWAEQLQDKRCIFKTIDSTNKREQTILNRYGIRSLMLAPVFAANRWYGFFAVDDCKIDRRWTDSEQDSLVAIAEILGSTIVRQRDQNALIDAKQHLEQRVEERTEELRKQVSAKEQALAELAETQSSLVAMSRAAGMAEVATGVLHNVGNVLNSINVSCTLITDQMQRSRISNIEKVADLLNQHKENLSQYLTTDEHGKQIPGYLISVAPALKQEHALICEETLQLHNRINHIKEIVAMQQSYGQISGFYETISPRELMEDALKLNATALTRHNIEICCEYEELPPLNSDKHQILQILLNLIQNAKNACIDSGHEKSTITLRLSGAATSTVFFTVEDNGIGIATENLTQIFQYGFTTRKEGHGFGLHSGALTAKELGGSLMAHSPGIGQGAVFTLTLPISQEVIHGLG
jgi:signal transduction histidine kinase/HAMP domain-containing protein